MFFFGGEFFRGKCFGGQFLAELFFGRPSDGRRTVWIFFGDVRCAHPIFKAANITDAAVCSDGMSMLDGKCERCTLIPSIIVGPYGTIKGTDLRNIRGTPKFVIFSKVCRFFTIKLA